VRDTAEGEGSPPRSPRRKSRKRRTFIERLKEHPLARIGPGLITGVADDDPSGIAKWSCRAGGRLS
jgi:Mn2+/Fe2+ NRAMP family transporter